MLLPFPGDTVRSAPGWKTIGERDWEERMSIVDEVLCETATEYERDTPTQRTAWYRERFISHVWTDSCIDRSQVCGVIEALYRLTELFKGSPVVANLNSVKLLDGVTSWQSKPGPTNSKL